MKLWLIVPIKPFGEGKSRLAGALPQSARAQLSQQLFHHVVRQAVATSVLTGIIVVSRDPTVLRGFNAPKLHHLYETGYGLNQALTAGRAAALQQNADAILILPADLPYLTTADIEALYQQAQRKAGVVIVPSTDNGTNALLLRPPTAIDFAYGRDSFSLHCQAAQQAGVPLTVHVAPHLTFDVDNPMDLRHLTPELHHALHTSAALPHPAR
ncbi:MAG: 2-phospho-L-lactate guanylyltransferase [Caldilineaceae bacterium]|nr:2-phospho-L-lactate guanylyltransferase [Caldilineaceae bacterium]